MTWKHIAMVALAVALLAACIVTRACTDNVQALNIVAHFANTIAAGAIGNALSSRESQPKT